MAQPNPPFPIARDVIEGYFDPSPAPAYKRMADLLEEVYKNPPRDEPMGSGFTPHFNLLKFCALAGVHMLYRHKWEPSARRWPTLPSAFTVMWTKPISRRRRSSAWKRASGHM
jgi:hypothetical protein